MGAVRGGATQEGIKVHTIFYDFEALMSHLTLSIAMAFCEDKRERIQKL